MAEKFEVDLEALEAEYRAGVKSLRAIGTEFGISEGVIRKYAKRYDWTRDLSAKIKAKAEELVRTDSVRDAVRTESDRVREKDIIEANAELQANIIRSHRKDITRYRALCSDLLDEIELMTGERLGFDQLGEIMADQETNRMNALYRKAVSMSTRVDSVKKLVDTLKTLVGLERQAFGIADNANGDANQGKNPIEDLFTALSGRVMGVTASPDDDDDDD